MTAPKTCEPCGAALDAGEVCTCTQDVQQTVSEPTSDGNMEFVMGDSLEHLPKTIDFNFQQLKEQLEVSLETYSGLVVTEDGIKAAKADRAKLNKLREALENKRKEVKNQCMVPYTDFESKAKELVGLIDKPIAAIDRQLKQFEDKRRAEKRAAILEIYDETIGELRALLPFDKLWQDSWYNTGASMKKIKEAIVAAECEIAEDLEVLSTVDSEFIEPVKAKYLDTMNLSAALAERARLQKRAEQFREYEQRRTSEQEQIPVQEPQTPKKPNNENKADTEKTLYRLCFECLLTMDQARDLSAWLKERKISFRRL